jgi:hypothetical protein
MREEKEKSGVGGTAPGDSPLGMDSGDAHTPFKDDEHTQSVVELHSVHECDSNKSTDDEDNTLK